MQQNPFNKQTHKIKIDAVIKDSRLLEQRGSDNFNTHTEKTAENNELQYVTVMEAYS